MTWVRGRDEVQRLIDDGEVEIVEASTDVADRLLREAHVRLASLGLDGDPAGALQLSYDAARKASAALLAVQGLRATTRGGHIAVIDAVRAQFNDRGGLPVFGQINRLRRRRNDTEYPSPTTPGVTTDEATQALGIAREVIDGAKKLLEAGRLDEFG
ncbi:MAG: HEPN domain-containing protein [Acidimicrobiales bacterium]|nr:HEPN domain-containing protein [Acidimicrobiales bacterium]